MCIRDRLSFDRIRGCSSFHPWSLEVDEDGNEPVSELPTKTIAAWANHSTLRDLRLGDRVWITDDQWRTILPRLTSLQSLDLSCGIGDQTLHIIGDHLSSLRSFRFGFNRRTTMRFDGFEAMSRLSRLESLEFLLSISHDEANGYPEGMDDCSALSLSLIHI